MRGMDGQHRRPRPRHQIEKIRIDDAHWLTQYGAQTADQAVANFRSAPRPNEADMSLLLGRLEPMVAEILVRKYITGTAMARYALARSLREAGFKVEHTPSPMNPLHVSVFPATNWDAASAEGFHSCFTDQHDREDA